MSTFMDASMVGMDRCCGLTSLERKAASLAQIASLPATSLHHVHTRESFSRTPRAFLQEEIQYEEECCSDNEGSEACQACRQRLVPTTAERTDRDWAQGSFSPRNCTDEFSESAQTSTPRIEASYDSMSESEADLDELLWYCQSSHAELKHLLPELLVYPEEFEVDYADSAKCILGEGGQARIFSAFCRDRQVAVKVSSRASVLREFSIAQRLAPHPNIVKVVAFTIVKPEGWSVGDPFEAGHTNTGASCESNYSTESLESRSSSWLYMAGYEFCEHGDLGSYLRANPAQSSNVAFMQAAFDGILAALEHIHAQDYIHSDVKPDNVLVTSSLQVRLSDFGLCQHRDSPMSPQGTPSYLAPEIVEAWFQVGVEHDFTTKVDIFSFGVLMVHTLTGKYPFSRITRLLKRGKPLSQSDITTIYNPSPEVMKVVETIDSRFAVMVKMCLRKNAEERPSATDLRRILGIRLSGERRSPFPSPALTRKAP